MHMGLGRIPGSGICQKSHQRIAYRQQQPFLELFINILYCMVDSNILYVVVTRSCVTVMGKTLTSNLDISIYKSRKV